LVQSKDAFEFQVNGTYVLVHKPTAIVSGICYKKATRNATQCNTLQHTATHYNTLQHTATHCNILPLLAEFATRKLLGRI